jgi:hypothetical protein
MRRPWARSPGKRSNTSCPGAWSEEEATSTIVRGFLNVDIPGLPLQLKAEIDRAIEESDKDVM